jgi:hypothetical protein
MGKKDDLKQIVSDLTSSRFEISIHALERMAERSLAAVDIIALIEDGSLERPTWNERHESWNFSGRGFTEDIFTIACTYEEDGTLIVTVFWE